MRRTGMIMPLVAGLLLLGATMSAHAATYTFNFNSLSATAASTTTANASLAIQNYMDGVLTAAGCTGCSVTVSGAVADQKYNGDNHVVGAKVGTSSSYTSLTLGDSDNAANNNASINTTTPTSGVVSYDTFISNTDDSSNQRGSQITITLNGFTLNGSVGFDYEVFPDGSSQQPPDFIFATNQNSNVFTTYGVTPGTTNGTATHSPFSGSGTEASQQYIGTYSGSLHGVNQLDFIDWPQTIGVDNLVITTTPEPGSLLLLGVGLSGLLLLGKKKQTA